MEPAIHRGKVNPRFRILLLGLVVCSSGCHSRYEGTRRPVQGIVLFEGKPLSHGTITFYGGKEPGTAVGGAMIRDGHYQLPGAQGLEPGKYRVTLTSGEAAPFTPDDYAAGKVPPPAKERIATEYNTASKITVQVEADGKNQFDFTIP